ncbi:hypothetical protein DPMN_038114 [Dreissena polymorpha]|uniref:Uncharacterized protein n=1 Tax=Dreissena polymorpha TaxID=45954 RepID=A0A9D4RQE2_DREPO|nr:hypothetical protein DPMN_038114 [Dreissena polymorpha]
MNLLTMFHEDRTINVASRVKNAPPLGSHVFQANITIFELIQDIIKTNLLTKFHEDWTMRPLDCSHRTIYNHTRKNAPPPGGHLHTNLTINVASRVLARKMPHLINPCFSTNRDIIGLNLMTKFHEDRTMNVASRVINAPKRTHFLIQEIIETNLPTKFHRDWTINAASRVSTMQMLTLYNAGRTKGDRKSSP